jgi:hypothetical protein
MDIKYSQWPYNRPNGLKIYQHFPLQDPQNLPKLGFFGLKTNHLASLLAPPLGLPPDHWLKWKKPARWDLPANTKVKIVGLPEKEKKDSNVSSKHI